MRPLGGAAAWPLSLVSRRGDGNRENCRLPAPKRELNVCACQKRDRRIRWFGDLRLYGPCDSLPVSFRSSSRRRSRRRKTHVGEELRGQFSTALRQTAAATCTPFVFQRIKDFDPGPAAFHLTSTGWDTFISKLDTAGNFVWAKQVTGPSRPTPCRGGGRRAGTSMWWARSTTPD